MKQISIRHPINLEVRALISALRCVFLLRCCALKYLALVNQGSRFMCHRDHALISFVEHVVVISIHRTVSCRLQGKRDWGCFSLLMNNEFAVDLSNDFWLFSSFDAVVTVK